MKNKKLVVAILAIPHRWRRHDARDSDSTTKGIVSLDTIDAGAENNRNDGGVGEDLRLGSESNTTEARA